MLLQTFALVNYLTTLYGICALWHSGDINQIVAVNPIEWPIDNGPMTNHTPIIWLKYSSDATDMEVDRLVQLGYNGGCQVNY